MRESPNFELRNNNALHFLLNLQCERRISFVYYFVLLADPSPAGQRGGLKGEEEEEEGPTGGQQRMH